MPQDIELEVTFPKTVLVREFHTAWNIISFKYMGENRFVKIYVIFQTRIVNANGMKTNTKCGWPCSTYDAMF